jgi:hypothetical protein
MWRVTARHLGPPGQFTSERWSAIVDRVSDALRSEREVAIDWTKVGVGMDRHDSTPPAVEKLLDQSAEETLAELEAEDDAEDVGDDDGDEGEPAPQSEADALFERWAVGVAFWTVDTFVWNGP